MWYVAMLYKLVRFQSVAYVATCLPRNSINSLCIKYTIAQLVKCFIMFLDK